MTIREDSINFTAQIRQNEITNLASELGVTPESLARLRIGKNSERSTYTFPLRQPNGFIVGISNRPIEPNSTRSKTTTGHGAGQGLFFDPAGLSSDYLIVTEGASDTAAVLSAGFSSVVGKMSASTGTNSIVQLCQRMQPRIVINLRDADKAATQGHKKLVRGLGAQSIVELFPDHGVKDASPTSPTSFLRIFFLGFCVV